MKRMSYLFRGALLLSFLGGLWLTAANWSALPGRAVQAPPVAEPPVSTIAAAVTTFPARAQVVPLREASLAFPVGGEVVEVLVEPGQVVASGDELIRLQDGDLLLEERLAQIAVQQAEADLASAEAELSEAQVALQKATIEASAASRLLALANVGPTEDQLALQNAVVAAADAEVARAAASQALLYEQPDNGDVAMARAELAVAQAELLISRLANEPVAQAANASPGERELAQTRLNAAQAQVVAAQARLDELVAGPSVPRQQQASTALTAAALDHDASMANLSLLLAGGRPETVALLEANLQEANRSVDEAELQVQRARDVIAQAESALEEASVTLEQARAMARRARLVAPFDGTVAAISVKKGEVAAAGVPVLVLADLAEWRLETVDLTQLDVARVRLGAAVSIVFDALASRTYHGWVVEVAARASDDHGQSDYAVLISLEEPDLPIRWGMTAAVAIEEYGGPTQ